MIYISEHIYQRMKEGELYWSPNDRELIGNTNFFENEDEDE